MGILVFCTGVQAQSTTQPSQLPKTAPATANILSSYEGQNVTSVEIAGRPDLDTSKLLPLLQQRAGEPFARAKVDPSIATLKSARANSDEVQLQIEPEANGVRVLLILEPAVWFGIFEFPGAERFAYSEARASGRITLPKHLSMRAISRKTATRWCATSSSRVILRLRFGLR